MKPPCEFKVMRVRECAPPGEMIDTPDRAAEYWRLNIPSADWYDPAKEMVVVLALNTRRRVIGHNLVAVGGIDSCVVVPLTVFRPIIVASAPAMVLMHNHPGGEPSPSQADIKVTRDLLAAARLLKIDLLDHVIMGETTHASLRNLGHFP